MRNLTGTQKNEAGKLFNLDGRVALITGAGGHLGRAIARALCNAGAHVVLNGRNAEKLEDFRSELRGLTGSASIAAFDVTKADQCRSAISEIEKTLGRLDILINNAYSGRTGTIESSSVSDFADAFNVTVSSAFILVQAALPLLAAAGHRNPAGASVINIASMYGCVSPDPSIYGESGMNSPPFYGSAKSGLIQLTRYLAVHLAARNIRVNCVSPGPFPRRDFLERNPKFGSELAKKTPMGRVGVADELAGPIVFLSSDASSFVTGANIPVDGGWTAW